MFFVFCVQVSEPISCCGVVGTNLDALVELVFPAGTEKHLSDWIAASVSRSPFGPSFVTRIRLAVFGSELG